jgi:hemolysin III
LARNELAQTEAILTDSPPGANRYSLGEEIANSITHGIGVGLSIAALSVLVTFAGLFGDAWRVVSFSIYGTTLILLYLASTIYHSFQSPRRKRILQVLDHSAIFLLIAGTYTPFTLVNLRGGWGWALFGLIWGLALCGILLEVLFMNRFKFLSVAVYVGMGWLVIIAVRPLLSAVPVGGLIWLGVGGLTYTLGVIFYLWERLPFNHAVWHLFVLGGSACHFFCILFYVLPMSQG